MKVSKILVFICSMSIVFVGGILLIKASAQENNITNQQIEIIRGNCTSIKNILRQLRASDALLRVNRGQTYESISTKLMNGFNSRVSNNNFNNSNFVSITKNFNQALNTFRSSYKIYEENLSSVINIDCSKNPEMFYNSVVEARDKRNRVHANIIILNQYVYQYQSILNKFEKDYKPAINGVN